MGKHYKHLTVTQREHLAKGLQSHQTAQLFGIQVSGTGGAYGRKIHSRAVTMPRGRSPRTPKLQGYVERANKTHRVEFYEVEDIDFIMEDHKYH